MTIAIEDKGLVKIYDGRVRDLDGIDLKVEAGDVFTLLGPNRNIHQGYPADFMVSCLWNCHEPY